MNQHRTIKSLIVGALLASVMVFGSNATPVEAACSGQGVLAYWDNWSYGKEFVGTASTCDNDGYYRGRVAEYGASQGDGYCAVVRAKGSSGSWTWQGYSCRNDSNWVSYNWNPGTTSGSMKICKRWRSWDCSPVEATWGM